MWLLVSFGVVRSRCRCALKKAFSLSDSFAWAKKLFFSANQKIFFCRKLYALPSKASRFRNQNTACLNHFLLSSKTAFSRTKNFLLHKPFLNSHPKQSFSTLHIPFALSLTYCPPKNTAVLLISALNPYAVKPEGRTDSNHCRRYPTKLQLFAKPVT